jgi:GNAT superfamily N-acetyltransferase
VSGHGIIFREATAADLPGISRVRTSVIENALTREQLDARGITNESVAASFLRDSKGWVAEQGAEILGFSIADRASKPIVALFVLPAFERRGIGSRLHDLALAWLWENGVARVWLTTDPQSKAARFYERRGWVANGTAEHGDVRYELARGMRA